MIKLVTLFAFVTIAVAHEGHHHGSHSTQEKQIEAKPNIQVVYQDIQEDYLKNVKPIFDLKCAACHSVDVVAPSYASWPIIGWIVESDRTEAKEHLEISKGFPFAGHGTPEEDLTAIHNEISKGEMPTFLYRLFHPSSRITPDEKTIILDWIVKGQNKIKENIR